jgi:acyl-CoA synthetase (AMP-forming)/AMP-acid ligase II
MSTDTMTRLWEYVKKWAERKPDQEALVFGDRRISWREFQVQVDRAAKAMLASGVQAGDRVGMVAMACPEFLYTFMAASKIGAIWLGMSPKFTVDELRYQLNDAQPTLLLTLREYAGFDLVQMGLTFNEEFPQIKQVVVIGEAREGTIDYGHWLTTGSEIADGELQMRADRVSGDSGVLLMYTSGSTGRPKGVLQTHRSIIANIEVEVRYFDFDEECRALVHFPINHVAADVEIGFAAILAGSALVMMDRFDPQESLEVIERERITLVGQVPVMYLMQFQAPKFKEMDWGHVRAFVWGGSSVPEIVLQVLQQISSRTGARLITGYGSTELCGFVTYSMEGDSPELLLKSAGKIVSPWDLKIVDPNRKELPLGEVGEIAVRGACVMEGYLNNPGITASVLDDEGWYYTSDLGWVDAEGYLFITGRSSEMYKSGGENVYPREIEEVLERHPAVLFSAVIGVADAVYSEVGHAFVMLKPGQQADQDELRAFCKQKLANFKVPKEFHVRVALPLLPNGKVNKMALKKELAPPT